MRRRSSLCPDTDIRRRPVPQITTVWMSNTKVTKTTLSFEPHENIANCNAILDITPGWGNNSNAWADFSHYWNRYYMYNVRQHFFETLWQALSANFCFYFSLSVLGSHDTHIFRLAEKLDETLLLRLDYPINLWQAENGRRIIISLYIYIQYSVYMVNSLYFQHLQENPPCIQTIRTEAVVNCWKMWR